MKEKISKFFLERYGHDSLNYFLLVLCIIFILLFYITKMIVFAIFNYICAFYCLYRSLSKNYYQRNAENEKFLNIIFSLKQRKTITIRNLKDKERRYYICPQCRQICRVPRKKGKIEIDCPHCHSKFIRKS